MTATTATTGSYYKARGFQRKPDRRPFVLGHRGARAHCPENTMRAFEEALGQGADGVELDVRMSHDGELFISHDDEIATASGPARLDRLSGTQIRALETKSGLPVPTLKQVLEFQAATGCYMNVELKGDVTHPLWMARRAAFFIRQHGGHGLVLSSFDARQVFLLSRLLPDVPTALLFGEQDVTVRRLATWGAGAAMGAVAVHPQMSVLTAELIKRLRARFELVNTWTVNTAEDAVRASELGVDAIITDDPRAVLQALG